MTQHAAVLEKAVPHLDIIETGSTIHTGSFSTGRSVFANLIAKLFASANPLRVVAFTSAEPSAGVTYMVRRLASELTRMTGQPVSVLNGAELRDWDMEDPILGIRGHASRPSERLAKLKDRSTFVLIDAGSMAQAADTVRLASVVDGVVLVVEAGRTTKSEITRAAASIADAQGKLLGVVLNKRKYPVPRFLYRLFR